ncbi:MAG: hypothetical protein IT438_04495 [Phycisphaerales bacterium]|nr:hypothetical protein [Phycisphaerales bacterium]
MRKFGQKCVRVPALAACFTALAAGAAVADDRADEPSSTLEALLRAGEKRAASRGEDSVAARERLFEQLKSSTHCFVEYPTQAQLDAIAALYDGLPPGLVKAHPFSNRFFTEPEIWSGVATFGQPAQTTSIPQNEQRPASRIRLSYSFPDDGTLWGADDTQLNTLNARLREMFPTEDPLLGNDHGRELMRQAMAQWRLACGVTYFEQTDDNQPLNTLGATATTPYVTGHGDIRIGGYRQCGGAGVLAFNYLPADGGDMTVNTSYFGDPEPACDPPVDNLYGGSASNSFRLFRNAISHEHGHGLGFLHSLPCNQTKLMEPFNSTAYDGPQIDELRGAQQNYGDRFAPNHSSAQAHDFGVLSGPGGAGRRSVRVQSLSTNGVADPGNGTVNPTAEDWFRFRIETAEFARITVRPTGGIYANGPQQSMCVSDMLASEQALTTGDLALEVYNAADPANPIGVLSMTGGPGVVEEIRFSNSNSDLNAGEYLVRVRCTGLGPSANLLKPVQLYDLEIRIGDPDLLVSQAPYGPLALAGINKRIRVGQTCQFIGDLLSRALEPGVALRTDQFEWDLNGDGFFDVSTNPDEQGVSATPVVPPTLLRQPRKVYTQNAAVPVTLRVTDDNGLQATDTILLVVTGDPIAVTSIDPGQGSRDSAMPPNVVPVRIVGTNLGAVISASQIGLDGSGVTVVGTPVAMNNGTEIVGLSFVIDPAAPLGFRNVTVTDGTTRHTLVDGFEVIGPANPPVNDECPGAIAWPPMTDRTAINDFDNADATQSPDQNFGSTPCAPGGMFADVWYTWTAPDTGNLTVRTNSLPQFSSRVAMYAGACPLPLTLLACAVDGANFTVPVQQGATYTFRVGSTLPRSGGRGTVTLIFDPTVGACCNIYTGACTRVAPNDCAGVGNDFAGLGTPCTSCAPPIAACCLVTGTCSELNQSDCATAGGAWQPGLPCGSVVCPPPPTGACCVPTDGSCTITTPFNCVGGNLYQGNNSVCNPNPCPQPTGACCAADGSCTTTTQAQCASGSTFQGIGTACSPNPCPQPPTGACCESGGTGICTTTTMAACTGVYQGDMTSCTPNPCLPPPGACCNTASGSCTLTANAGDCVGGAFQGPSTSCTPNPCPQPPTGACCLLGGGCAVSTQQDCTSGGGSYVGHGTSCGVGVCSPLTGACCFANGSCNQLTPTACTGAVGNFQGLNSSCTPNPCPQPTNGSCCRGTGCVVVAQASCVGGRFGGVGSTCTAPTCCQADLDSNGLSIQDLFDYLDYWFALDPRAEFDLFAGVELGDLFAFLDAYFAGCSTTTTTGSCCVATTCTVAEPTACGGLFGGAGTTCTAPTCCQADINSSGQVSSQDIFDYLTYWFALDPRAEADGLPGITLQDLFDYLDLFFAGC